MIFAWIVCSAIRRLAAKAMNKSVDRGPFLKGESATKARQRNKTRVVTTAKKPLWREGSTSLEEPVKECEKNDTGADELPQGHRAQENSHLPEEISQQVGCLGCEQAVFDHRLLASGE